MSNNGRRIAGMVMIVFLLFTIPIWLPNVQYLSSVIADSLDGTYQTMSMPAYGQQSGSDDRSVGINLSNNYERSKRYDLQVNFQSDDMRVMVDATQNGAQLEIDMSGKAWQRTQDQVLTFLRSMGLKVQVRN